MYVVPAGCGVRWDDAWRADCRCVVTLHGMTMAVKEDVRAAE